MAVVEVHLIALAVPEGGRGAGSLPEGAVEGGGVLDRIGHDRDRRVAGGIQGLADGPHAAVHHIRGRHHIGASLHMGEGRHGQEVQRPVIVDIAAAQDAAVAVRGIFAHTDIRDEIELRKILLRPAQGALDDTVRAVGLGPHLVLFGRNSEKHDLADACLLQPRQLFSHAVYGPAVLAGKGRDLLHRILAVHDKHGVDQGCGIQTGLPHHAPQCIASPQSPGSDRQIHFYPPLYPISAEDSRL